MMKKEASIALNLLSIGEGTAAISTGSKLEQIFTAYGMTNDVLSLQEDLTGKNPIDQAFGSFYSELNTPARCRFQPTPDYKLITNQN